MRVVAFLHAPKSPLGALGLGYSRIRTALEGRGHSLELVTPDDFPWVGSLPLRTHVLVFPLAVAWRLWRRRGAVDLAVFHSYAGWLFNLWKRGVPTITAFHGLETIEYVEQREESHRQGLTLSWRYRLTYGPLMNLWLGLTCRRSNRVLCLNSEEEHLLVVRGWVTPKTITRFVHGVPPEGHARARDYVPTARRVLVVSQWVDRKGIRYIVDAFTALVRDGLDLELRCVGTRTPAAVVLQSFPDDIRSRVSLVESAPNREVLAEYGKADIFVHAALLEGMSRAQTEAMAAALPIVTTRCGAAAIDLLTDDDSCLMVPMRDADALADAVRRLVADQPLRARLGRAAGAIAGRNLNLEHTLDALMDVYEEVHSAQDRSQRLT